MDWNKDILKKAGNMDFEEWKKEVESYVGFSVQSVGLDENWLRDEYEKGSDSSTAGEIILGEVENQNWGE